MDYIRIKNWAEFQHYKHREPPWIKLHCRLLDNDRFDCLQDDSKLLLIMLWLFNARRGDGKIRADEKWLAKKLPVKKIKLQPLIRTGFIEVYQDDSVPQAPCQQSADTEKRRVEESRVETERKFVPPTISQINEYCTKKNIYVNAQKFINHYGAKGWMIGKNKMKDWRLAVGNAVDWDCNRLKQPPPKPTETDKIEKIKREKQKSRDEWEVYLRAKSTVALKDLLKDKESRVYYFAGWLIKEILAEREGKCE